MDDISACIDMRAFISGYQLDFLPIAPHDDCRLMHFAMMLSAFVIHNSKKMQRIMSVINNKERLKYCHSLLRAKKKHICVRNRSFLL